MKKLLGILLVLALVLSFSLVATTPVAAATITVGPGGLPTYDHATIQAAIAAAVSGDTIMVAAGDYVEVGQIVINKNLSIVGADKATTIIKPNQNTGSSGDARGWFLVQAGNEFNLSNVTLDGEGKQVHQAIRSFGSGIIDNNIIKNIRYSQYTGLAMVGMAGSSMVFSNNTFSDIERIGMMAFGTGTTAQMIGNTYTGKGAGDYLDYGIEIGGGATATITGNTFTDCGPSTTAWGSAGIMVNSIYADPGEVSGAAITANTLTNNEYGIFVGYGDDAPDEVIANFNNIFGNTQRGIISKTAVAMDATHNWWGDASGPSGEGPGSGDSVSANVDFSKWLGAAITDQATGCTADRDTGATASPSTDNASAAATGGGADTVIYVAEFVGNPTSVSPRFASGAFFFDVFVSGTAPSQLVVVAKCPGGNCAGMVLKWFDYEESRWRNVTPVSVVGGTVVATLSATSVPTVAQLKGQPFGLGNTPTVGWEGSSVNKAAVMAPWIAMLATMMAGATLLAARRRRARI